MCFNRKVIPIPRSRPTFKLALILLLAGDVSLNHGPVVRHNIHLATTNIRSIREKTASLTDLIISKTIQMLLWLRPGSDRTTQTHVLPRHFLSWLYLPPSTTSSCTRWWCWFPYLKTIQRNPAHQPSLYQLWIYLSKHIKFVLLWVFHLYISRSRPPPNFFEEFQGVWKMLQPCTQHFTLLGILIFTWIHHQQQLPRLMTSWHHLTRNNMSISQHTYMDIGLTSW